MNVNKNIASSLLSLVKFNGGAFKSEKQAFFLLKHTTGGVAVYNHHADDDTTTLIIACEEAGVFSVCERHGEELVEVWNVEQGVITPNPVIDSVVFSSMNQYTRSVKVEKRMEERKKKGTQEWFPEIYSPKPTVKEPTPAPLPILYPVSPEKITQIDEEIKSLSCLLSEKLADFDADPDILAVKADTSLLVEQRIAKIYATKKAKDILGLTEKISGLEHSKSILELRYKQYLADLKVHEETKKLSSSS